MRTREELHDGWTLHLVGVPANESLESRESEALRSLPIALSQGQGLTATVPGCVHTDLLAHGLIADPHVDSNEELQHWIGRCDWEYRCIVWIDEPLAGEVVELVCDGLDTIATVYVNDLVVAQCANMHRTFRIDIASALRPGRPNGITVRFAAPTTHAEQQQQLLGAYPNPYDQVYPYIRKQASNFGWDWGPTLTTSGIWKPIALERWLGARLRAVRPAVVAIAPQSAQHDATYVAELRVDVDIIGVHSDLRVRCDVTHSGGAEQFLFDVEAGAQRASAKIAVAQVKRWWPSGRGEQPLAVLRTTLETADGQVLDECTHQIGFRTIELDQSAEADGNRFAFIVNGERVWVRGLNWITDSCFPTSITREQLRTRLQQAVDIHASMIRVWGGGIYESDDFYELCDELGLLVWQDFTFACAAYPESFADEVRAEAIDNVNRLMHHASLALWCGNNECEWGYWDWDWKPVLGDRGWGDTLYREVIPSVLTELDPTRAYIPGSPISLEQDVHPNDPASGPIHIWDVWNDKDYLHYRTYSPRFASEFGFQASPNWSTFAEAITARPLRSDHPDVLRHQKALDGAGKLDRRLVANFGPQDPADFERWVYLTQLNQSRALDVAFQHFRSQHERCSGAIWWQLNDCWPSISWSLVDSASRRKLAWYAARRSFADRLVCVGEDGKGDLQMTVVNDSRERWSGSALVRRVNSEGAVCASVELSFDVAPDAARALAIPGDVGRTDSPTSEFVLVDYLPSEGAAGSQRTVWQWRCEKELVGGPGASGAEAMTVSTSALPTGYALTVTAHTLLRDVALMADCMDADAEVDDQLITLLPGETHVFCVDTSGPVRESAVAAQYVWCANVDATPTETGQLIIDSMSN